MAEQAFGVSQLNISDLELRKNGSNLELGGVALATQTYADSAAGVTAGDGIAVSGSQVSIDLDQSTDYDTLVVTGGALAGTFIKNGNASINSATLVGTDTVTSGTAALFYKQGTVSEGLIYNQNDSKYYHITTLSGDFSTSVSDLNAGGSFISGVDLTTSATDSNSGVISFTDGTALLTGTGAYSSSDNSHLEFNSGNLAVSVSTNSDFSVDGTKITDRASIKTLVDAVTATSLGLGSVDNTSDADKPVSTAQQTALDAKVDDSEKGAANGVATLDGSGLVPSAQLPSYVDDVLEYANEAAFPGTGESGKIYVALDNNSTHRWSGSAYVEISNVGVADGEVTNAKLAADAVDGSKIADDSIDSEHLVDGSVDAAHLESSVQARLITNITASAQGSTAFTLDSIDSTSVDLVEWFVQGDNAGTLESYKVVADGSGDYSTYAHLGNSNIPGFTVVVDKSGNDVRLRASSTSDIDWKAVRISL